MRSDRKNARANWLAAIRLTGILGSVGIAIFGGHLVAAQTPDASVVEIFGCRAMQKVGTGIVCVPNPLLRMVLWVKGRSCDVLQLTEGASALRTESHSVQGGCQIFLPKGEGGSPSELTVTDSQTRNPLWRMTLDRSRTNLFPWRTRIFRRALSDVSEQTAANLRRKRDLETDPEAVLDLTSALAIVYDFLGEKDLARREMQSVRELSLSLGYVSTAFDADYRTAAILREAGFGAEAIGVLNGAEALICNGCIRPKVLRQYEMALCQRDSGKWSAAAEWSARALLDAEKVADQEWVRNATVLVAETRAALGLPQEADLTRRYDQLFDGASECAKAQLRAGQGWIGLMTVDESKVGQPVKLGDRLVSQIFEDALRHHKECGDEIIATNIYSGLAMTAYYEQDNKAAHDWMNRARASSGLRAHDLLDLHELEGRLALREGRASDALQSFGKLETLSSQLSGIDRELYACKVDLGTAEAQRLSGMTPDKARAARLQGCLNAEVASFAPAEMLRLQIRAGNSGLTR